MKINDKVIAAFLVSIGVFSVAQAGMYVATLSVGEKKTLLTAARLSDKGVVLCEETTSRPQIEVNAVDGE